MDTTTRLIRNSSKRSKNVKAILSNSESISIWQSERDLARWKMCIFLHDQEKDEEERMVSSPESGVYWGVHRSEEEEYLQQVEAFYMSNIYTKNLFPRTYRENMVLQPVTVSDLSLFKEKFCDKRNASDDEARTLCVIAWFLMLLMMLMMFSRCK